MSKRQQLSYDASSKKRHASGSSEAAALDEYVCGPAQYWFPEAVESIGGSLADLK